MSSRDHVLRVRAARHEATGVLAIGAIIDGRRCYAVISPDGGIALLLPEDDITDVCLALELEFERMQAALLQAQWTPRGCRELLALWRFISRAQEETAGVRIDVDETWFDAGSRGERLKA